MSSDTQPLGDKLTTPVLFYSWCYLRAYSRHMTSHFLRSGFNPRWGPSGHNCDEALRDMLMVTVSFRLLHAVSSLYYSHK